MISILKLELQALAVTPVVVSVGSARLSHARVLPKSDRPRLLSAPSYAGTDAPVVARLRSRAYGSDVSASAATPGFIGLADIAEGPWKGEQAGAIRRLERPAAGAACEQTQQQASGMTMAAFAGNHGYPSWRTKT